MLGLLAVAMIAAAPGTSVSTRTLGRMIIERPPLTAEVAAPMPNLYRAPAHCGDQRYQVVDRYGRPLLLPLASLPTPSLQLAVDRRIDGCPVITVAHGWSPPVADQPNPPARQYRIQPLRPGR